MNGARTICGFFFRARELTVQETSAELVGRNEFSEIAG